VQADVWRVCLFELFGNDLGAVWAAIVDDYEFPIETAMER
jgi:hypothetical protein